MDEHKLLQKCLKGDRRAWDDFLKRYSRLIYNYIHSVFRITAPERFQQDSVREVFQDIFVILAKDNYRKLRSFRGRNGASFATWLRQVVINRTISYIRRGSGGGSLRETAGDVLKLFDTVSAPASLPSEVLISAEKLTALDACIEYLNSEEKYFLELHFYRGFALEKIKAVLGISRSAMDMRKFRLIDKLRDCFKSKGFSFGPEMEALKPNI